MAKDKIRRHAATQQLKKLSRQRSLQGTVKQRTSAKKRAQAKRRPKG